MPFDTRRTTELLAQHPDAFLSAHEPLDNVGQDAHAWIDSLTPSLRQDFLTILKVQAAPEVHPLLPLLVLLQRRESRDTTLEADLVPAHALRFRMMNLQDAAIYFPGITSAELPEIPSGDILLHRSTPEEPARIVGTVIPPDARMSRQKPAP
jgi:hypothetical protein